MKKDSKKGKRGQREDGRFQKSKRVNGRRIYGYGYTVKEAEEDLRKKVAEAEQGVLPDAKKLTVAQYFEEYLARRELDLRASTSYRWPIVVRNHIVPSIGHIQLRKLEPRHIQDWIIKLSKTDLKGSTIRGYYTILRTALNDAAKAKLIARSPCEHITLPAMKKPDRNILSPDQLHKLMGELEYPWLAFFIMAFSTGMRKGELLSLRWEDVDFVSGRIRIHRNVAYAPDKGYVEDGPKTESSNRSIVLQAFAAQALKDHQHGQKLQRIKAVEWEEKGLVFCRSNGEFWHPHMPNYSLGQALGKAGLDTGISPHSGRHTLASQLLGRKINPKIVQEILGHSDITMTLGMYNHTLPDAHEEAMGQMNDVFWGQEKDAK